MSHCDLWQVLTLAKDVAWVSADSLRSRGTSSRRRCTRTLNAGVHVSLVVVTDVEHVIVALKHSA